MVSESNVVGSRSKGSLPTTIVVVCDAGKTRDLGQTWTRDRRVGLIILTLNVHPVHERIVRSPSLLDGRTHAECVRVPVQSPVESIHHRHSVNGRDIE